MYLGEIEEVDGELRLVLELAEDVEAAVRHIEGVRHVVERHALVRTAYVQ